MRRYRVRSRSEAPALGHWGELTSLAIRLVHLYHQIKLQSVPCGLSSGDSDAAAGVEGGQDPLGSKSQVAAIGACVLRSRFGPLFHAVADAH